MLTIYKRNANDFRVVRGTHDQGEYRHFARVDYSDASLAYAIETDPHIRAAIAPIDPTAANQSPAQIHHAEPRQKMYHCLMCTSDRRSHVINSYCDTDAAARVLLTDRAANGEGFADEYVSIIWLTHRPRFIWSLRNGSLVKL